MRTEDLTAETLLRGCPTPLARMSMSGEALATNTAWDTRIGSGSVDGLVHAEERGALVAAREAALEGAEAQLVEARLASGARARFTLWRADDRSTWISAEPLGDEHEARVARILVDCFRVMDASLWSCDREGNILVSDGNALAHLGLAPGQLVGTNLHALYPSDSPAIAVLQRTLAGESFFYEDVSPKAHWLNVYAPLRDADGTVTGLESLSVNFGKDLVLAKASKALGDAIARLPIVVWAIDDKGTCTLLAGALLEHFGMTEDMLLGKNLFEAYADRPDIAASMRRALTGDEHIAEHPFGGLTLRTRYVPLKGPFGELIGVCASTEDVTEQHRVEAQLRDQLELIAEQRRAIVELGTPIIEVWQDVLAVPVVGSLDTARAEQMLGALLDAVANRSARFAILDLTGVESVDTATAQHLVRVVEAVRLLGCEGLITGIRSSVAETLVALGVSLTQIRTLRSLKDALRFCAGAAGRRTGPEHAAKVSRER